MPLIPKSASAFLLISCCFLTACSSNPEQEIAEEIQKTPAEWITTAQASNTNNRPQEARQQYQQALLLEPDNTVALEGLAKTHTQLGDYEAALRTWNVLLEKDPDSIEASISKARLLVRFGQLLDANEILQKMANSNNNDWRIWNTLGVIHDLQQDYTRAREYYSTALSKNNRQAEIYNNLGYSQIMTHAYDDAIATFRKGLKYTPDSEHMQSNLAIAYAWKGDYEKARLLFAEQMDDAEACNNVGYIAMLKNDFETADRYFQMAIDNSASFYRKAYQNLEKLREKQGKPREMAAP